MKRFGALSERLQGYLIASVVLLGITYALLFHVTDETRKGCERLDAVRAVEYRVLTGAQKSLQAQADVATDPAEQQRLQNRADAYSRNIQKLEDTASEYAEYPGSIHVDCTQAYGYPWPF